MKSTLIILIILFSIININFILCWDGILYYEREISDESDQVIHLDRVLSQFENGWGVENPQRTFRITGMQIDSSNVNDDNGSGSIFDVDSLGNAASEITGYPWAVADDQGLIRWVPGSVSDDQKITIFYDIVPSNGPIKQCSIIIERYVYCAEIPSLKNAQGMTLYSPPTPYAKIHFNTDTFRFELTVNTSYIRDDGTYLIDFDDFDAKTDTIRENSECSNRDSLPDADQLAFDSLWYSAPTANFPSALDGSYSAYPTKDGWLMDSKETCNETWYITDYSFSDFVGCKNRDGSYAIDYNYENGLIVYSGNVYVNALVPADKHHEVWGYSKFRHVYPFEFGFKQKVTALVGLPSEAALRVFVRSAEVEQDGTLKLVVETQYADPQGLQNAVVDPTRITNIYGDPPCTNAISICIQEWIYTSDNWEKIDNGNYDFGWEAVVDNHFIDVMITIEQEVQEVQVQTGIAIGTLDLRLFETLNEYNNGINEIDYETKVFNPREEIFLRGDLIVPEEDQLNFGLELLNVWICYSSIEGYNIEYIEDQKEGCLDPFIQENEKFQLVLNQAINTAAKVSEFEAYFPELVLPWSNPIGPSTGLSFLAIPQLLDQRTYTIHVEALITQNAPQNKRSVEDYIDYVDEKETKSHKRSVHFIKQSHQLRAEDGDNSVNALAFSVSNEQNGDNEDKDNKSNGSNLIWIGIGSIGCVAGIGLIVVGVFLYRKRKRKNQEFSSELNESIENNDKQDLIENA